MEVPPRHAILEHVLGQTPSTGGFPSKEQLIGMFDTEEGIFVPSEALWSRALHEIGWKASARNMLRVPLETQRVFRDSPLTEVFPSDLFLPHMTVYISLPDCPLTIWGDDRTGNHRIRGVFISRMRFDGGSRNDEEGFAFFLNGHANDKSIDPTDDANFWFNIPADTTESLEDLIQQGTALRNPLIEEGMSFERMEHVVRSGAASREAVRIALNALLFRGERTPESNRRIEEREEIVRALGRLKNQSKGKARRLLRRLTVLEEDPIVLVVPTIPSGRWVRLSSREERVAKARERLRLASTKDDRAAALLDVRIAMSSSDTEGPTLRWKENEDG